MKFKKLSTVLIWSGNFKRLADWYKDVLKLKVVEEINHPKDTGVLFEISPDSSWLWIGQHSKVKGTNADPNRHMFNLDVDSVQQAFKYLQNQGVKVVAKPFKAPTFDKHFATFQDIDGNIFQIIGNK